MVYYSYSLQCIEKIIINYSLNPPTYLRLRPKKIILTYIPTLILYS